MCEERDLEHYLMKALAPIAGDKALSGATLIEVPGLVGDHGSLPLVMKYVTHLTVLPLSDSACTRKVAHSSDRESALVHPM
jgi:hypothetical protein